MGKHKENKGKKNGWKYNKKKWDDEACCSALDKVSLEEGSYLRKYICHLWNSQLRLSIGSH